MRWREDDPRPYPIVGGGDGHRCTEHRRAGKILERNLEESRHTDEVFLGDDLLAWLTLAIGGAMAVGNVLAVVRPPEQRREDSDLESAPVARSLFFAVIGLAAAIWALATLLSGDDGTVEALQPDRAALRGADDLGEAAETQPQ